MYNRISYSCFALKVEENYDVHDVDRKNFINEDDFRYFYRDDLTIFSYLNKLTCHFSFKVLFENSNHTIDIKYTSLNSNSDIKEEEFIDFNDLFFLFTIFSHSFFICI